jgi:hypothetical protein
MNRRVVKRRLEERGLFMVETYTATGGRTPPDPLPVDGDRVLGVIDIPGDEMTLYMVVASDADGAEQIVLDRGLRPIRVVDVRWEVKPLEEPGRVSGKRRM